MRSARRGKKSNSAKGKKVRYAVVGLGYIAQNAVLPAFAHARNSELTALVSDNPTKLKKLSKKYSVPRTYSYEQYSECLESGEVDAVYIALPNHMHRQYTEAAANAGVHVLCEKPMAVTEQDCQAMIGAAEKNNIKYYPRRRRMAKHEQNDSRANKDAARRDPEDREVDKTQEQESREKMMDKTLADSYPASDPPSSIPDPAEDDSAA